MIKSIAYVLLIIIGIFISTNCSKACTCKASLCIETKIKQSSHLLYCEVLELGNKRFEWDHIKTMKVRVIEKYKGRETEQIITIFGQDGINCLEDLEKFTVGSKFLFILYDRNFNDNLTINSSEFSLSGCGKHYFNIDTTYISDIIKERTSKSITRITRKKNARFNALRQKGYSENKDEIEILRGQIDNIRKQHYDTMDILSFLKWVREVAKI